MVTIDALVKREDILPPGLFPMVEEKAHKSLLLVPFELSKWSPHLLESAMNMADRKGAELIFLCIRLSSERSWEPIEGERHFTALKSLQAQLQHRQMSVSIETVVGPAAQTLVDYVRRNNANMILVPAHEVTPRTGRHEAVTA